MPAVRKLRDAEEDIEAIARYLLEQGATYAVTDKFVADLNDRFEAHARQPLMGNLCEDLGPDLRCFSFRKSYVAIYRPAGDGIDVLRVFHTARDYACLFREGSHRATRSDAFSSNQHCPHVEGARKPDEPILS